MTTSNKTKFHIVLSRLHPEYGPPLKVRIWLDEFAISDHEIDLRFEDINFESNIQDGKHCLRIEHYDRHEKNTLIDENGRILTTSCVQVMLVEIADVRFKIDASQTYCEWQPNLNQSETDWAKKHKPGDNLPQLLPADNKLYSNGSLNINFYWPLSVHGIYHQSFLYQVPFYHKKFYTNYPGTKDANIKLYQELPSLKAEIINTKLSRRNIPFEIIYVHDLKECDYDEITKNGHLPILYKKGKFLCDCDGFFFLSVNELLD